MNSQSRLAIATLTAAAITTMSGCVVVVGNHSTRYDDEWYERYDVDKTKTIGVMTEPVGRALAAQTGVNPDKATMISEVFAGRPAERAGLQKYDIITQIDGVDSAPPGRLREVIRSKNFGDTINLRILRNGQPMDICVTLDPESKPGYSG